MPTHCLLVALMACASAASEPATEPAEVLETLSSGAVVNWTRLTVQADFSHQGSGVAGRQQATEQLARQRVGPAIQDSIHEVRATSLMSIDDLMEDPKLAEPLGNRVKLWAVSEATYGASGTVTLHGELDLADYLRPWTLGLVGDEPGTPTVSGFSGLVIDARGLSVQPSFAPRILGSDGTELWDGHLWEDAALVRSPVSWVADPAHPAAARVGDEPLVVRARGVRQGSELVLSEEGTAAVRRHLVGSPVMGEGLVVVVVDP